MIKIIIWFIIMHGVRILWKSMYTWDGKYIEDEYLLSPFHQKNRLLVVIFFALAPFISAIILYKI